MNHVQMTKAKCSQHNYFKHTVNNLSYRRDNRRVHGRADKRQGVHQEGPLDRLQQPDQLLLPHGHRNDHRRCKDVVLYLNFLTLNNNKFPFEFVILTDILKVYDTFPPWKVFPYVVFNSSKFPRKINYLP